MKIKPIKILVFLALLLIPLIGLKASEMNTNEAVFVAKDEIISGNLFAMGESVTIYGVVSGDLIVAAKSIIVTGRIEGDIIAIAQNINIDGDVGGNIRVIGNSVIINGSVTRNINAFGADVVIGEKARVGWDILAVASNIQIKGNVDGSLSAYSNNIVLSGKIGKNTTLGNYNNQEQTLIISNEAVINGDLNYTAKNKANINPKADISGQINYQEPPIKEKKGAITWMWGRLFSVLSMILIGLIFVFALKNYSKKLLLEIANKPGKSILLGALAILITPLACLVLVLTIIGIPLAAILMSLWFIGMLIGKTISAIFVGEQVIKLINKKIPTQLFWPMIIGSIILPLLFSLPFIGWLICLIAIWLGLGSILSYVNNQSKNI